MKLPEALSPRTLAEILDRAGDPLFARWQRQVQRCGCCARPIRMRGRILRDGAEIYSTAREPDGVAYIRCGNRRSSVCPSCSYEYAGDMWQLLAAGVAGGRKGVPATVANHPLVFVTLTAPSFGPVHGVRDDNGRCRPRREGKLCPHGRPTWCIRRHHPGDAALGQPLCLDCYDHVGAVLFNWHAPELWRRFAIALRRALAHRLGMTATELNRTVRLSYAKVAELQLRGVVHFHAIVRLDAAEGDYQAPDIDVSHEILDRAVHDAARRVRLVVPSGANQAVALSWGAQVDVRPIRTGQPAGEITPEVVAAYIAKYATKAAEDFGTGDRPVDPPMARQLDLSAHVVRMIETAWRLSIEVESLERLRRWTHMLGFRGHYSTKSRRYSITLGSLRRARANYRRRQDLDGRDVRTLGDDHDEDDTTLLVGEWTFAGVGWRTSGDALLAAEAAARAREWRQLARDEASIRTTTEGVRRLG